MVWHQIMETPDFSPGRLMSGQAAGFIPLCAPKASLSTRKRVETRAWRDMTYSPR
jgi:hypothetical protein